LIPRSADGAGGANINQPMSSDPDEIEPLAGMVRLTGVPACVKPAAKAARTPA
jgi:hypothetical protein